MLCTSAAGVLAPGTDHDEVTRFGRFLNSSKASVLFPTEPAFTIADPELPFSGVYPGRRSPVQLGDGSKATAFIQRIQLR